MKGIFILRKLFLNDFWSHRFLVLSIMSYKYYKILSYIQKAGFKIYFALNNYLPNILWNSVNLTKRNSHGSLHFASQSFLLLQQCNFFCQEKYTFLCFWNCNKLHNNAVNLSEISTDEMMHRPGLHAKNVHILLLYFWKSPAKT